MQLGMKFRSLSVGSAPFCAILFYSILFWASTVGFRVQALGPFLKRLLQGFFLGLLGGSGVIGKLASILRVVISCKYLQV